MALPEVGLQAVLEGVDQFEKGAKTIADAMRFMAREAQTLAKESTDAAEQTTTAWQSMAQLMSLGELQKVAGTAGQVGNQLLGMAKAATMTAARAEELDAVLGNLAQQNNLSAGALRGQVAAIKEQGITTAVASNLVSQFVRSNLDLEKASKLARIAQDAAVISMEDSSQALGGLLHGILTLQPEILRYRGIIVDLQGEYTKWAQANNRAVQSMTGAEKQMIALDAVIEQGASIAGTYEAAMDTAGKQLRSFDRYIEELREDFGQALLPVFTEGVFAAKDLTKALMALPEPLKASVALTGALAGGLLKGTSAMIGFGAQIAQIAVALNALNISLNTTALAILGPVGLVAALAAVVGVGLITYVNQQEKAHRDEAAAILENAGSYADYIQRLRDASLEGYAFSEALYEVIKAKKEADDAFDTRQMQESVGHVQDLAEAYFTVINAWTMAPEDPFTSGDMEGAIAEITKSLTDMDLIVAQDTKQMIAIAEAIGLTREQAERFASKMAAAAEATAVARQETEDYNKFERERYEILQQAASSQEDWTKTVADSIDVAKGFQYALAQDYASLQDLYDALRDVNPEVEKLRDGLIKIIEKEGMGAALSQTVLTLKEAAQDAQDEIQDAEDKAAEKREDARAKLMDSLSDLEKDHGERVADILGDLAENEEDLLQDLLDAERQYQEDRLALEQDYAAEIAQAEQDLADARADAYQDLQRALADLQREYDRDRQDAAQDLAHDLEEIDRDLAKAEAGIWQDYYAELESLAADHGQRMADITKRYTDARKRIEDKYRTESTREELREEEREALLAQLEELRRLQSEGLTGIDYSQAINDVLAALEQLKQEELAALAHAEAEEKQAEETAWQERQRIAQERRDAELAAEQAAAEAQRAERQRQYEEQLADLKQTLDREREDRQRSYQEKLADLEASHQQELAAIHAANIERMAQLDQRLAEERARLQQATVDEAAELQKRLAQEQASYAERQTELEGAYAEQSQTIDTELGKQVQTIDEKLTETENLYLEAWKGIRAGTAEALRLLVEQDIRPNIDAAIAEFMRLQQAIQSAGMTGRSPAPFWLKMGESWSEGLLKGFPATKVLGDIGQVFRGFEGAMGQSSKVAQMAPMTMAGNTTITNDNRRVNQLNYTGSPQTETSIQSIFTLMEMGSA